MALLGMVAPRMEGIDGVALIVVVTKVGVSKNKRRSSQNGVISNWCNPPSDATAPILTITF